MISEFIQSWELFQNTYLAGYAIALLLAMLGVLIVARDQIFIGAAITQASTLGIALALWAGVQGDFAASLLAVGFSVAASLLTARRGGASHESNTGWVFLFSSAAAILVVAHSPHGLEEVHRLLSSSIIGANTVDVAVFFGLAALTAAIFMRFHRALCLLVLDSEMAAAAGLRVGVLLTALAVWLGLSIGLSLRTSGMLYTFGCLVLPALCAKSISREIRQMFFIAPMIGVCAAAVGFVLAHHYDAPPASMTVTLLGVAMVFSRIANAIFGVAR